MMNIAELTVPMVQAPMAGGVATPSLVAAVSEAGGMGYLAAGYLSARRLGEQIEAVRRSTSAAFGVNVFVPHRITMDDELWAYLDRIRGEAASREITVPQPDPDDTDDWENKIRLLLDAAVPAVSFTFGAPDANLVRQFHEVGTQVAVTVTSAREARLADTRGVDALCVQGPEAGGHRATFDQYETPSTTPLTGLLDEIRAVTDLPLIAAGGISTAEDVARVLERGAVAAQLGTAYLCADEAGTNPVHRAALHNPRFTATTLTRAFSGRWARGLRNDFIVDHADAPAGFPVIDQLTKPLRAAAAHDGDPERLHLWAGAGFRQTCVESAGEFTARVGHAALARLGRGMTPGR